MSVAALSRTVEAMDHVHKGKKEIKRKIKSHNRFTHGDLFSKQSWVRQKLALTAEAVAIYIPFYLDVAQGRINGVHNDTRTHSLKFASLPS